MRWTSLSACCNDRAVWYRGTGFLRVKFTRLNSLDTHAALLHDSTASNRYVRIQYHAHQAVLRWVEVGKLLITWVVEPVETTHLVRAVVRAVTRTDASVVRHLIQSFIRVRGGGNGANRLTRSVVAVLAHHRHVNGLRVGRWIFHLSVRSDDACSFLFASFQAVV